MFCKTLNNFKYNTGEKACMHMPLEDMVGVLVKMGILQEPRKPSPTLATYAGPISVLGAAYQQAGTLLFRRRLLCPLLVLDTNWLCCQA